MSERELLAFMQKNDQAIDAAVKGFLGGSSGDLSQAQEAAQANAKACTTMGKALGGRAAVGQTLTLSFAKAGNVRQQLLTEHDNLKRVRALFRTYLLGHTRRKHMIAACEQTANAYRAIVMTLGVVSYDGDFEALVNDWQLVKDGNLDF